MRTYPKGLFLVMALLLLLSSNIAVAGTETPTTDVENQGNLVNTPHVDAADVAVQGSAATNGPTGALADPYGPGGYPNDVPAFAVPDASTYTTLQPEDWETGTLCVDNDVCLSGDFNGDGKDDVAVLKREFGVGAAFGDVLVALAGPGRFEAATKWHDDFCAGAVCKTGDVNADNRSDIVSFNRATGNVNVLISTGAGFAGPQLWNASFCVGQEQCEVGDFNGDNRDDILLFRKSFYSGGQAGDVLVSLSNGTAFAGVGKWQDVFCLGNEVCAVGDLNADGRDDVVAFEHKPRNSSTTKIIVAPSQGGQFNASPSSWNNYFCPADETCAIADANGDGRDDALALAIGNPINFGDIYVGLSGGTSILAGAKWNEQFCVPGQECVFGDYNGDGRDDIAAFVKSGAQRGQVFVALSGGSPVGFELSPGNPPGKWHDYFCLGQEVCSTGDFNGDGKTDIIYFVRSTQVGSGEGDVFVALSNGTSFGVAQKWHDYFCLGQDNCQIGDFNGDGADDIVSFSRVVNGQVYVALSSRNGFGASQIWNGYFCPNPEWCEVGDFNGDHLDDIVTFLRNTYGNTNAGQVNVAISNGSSFVTMSQPWNSNLFCIQNEWCDVGDFNGDGRDDIIAFAKWTSGRVFVGISTGVNFMTSGIWNNYFCPGNEVCRIGDVNADGVDDILTFLRSEYVSTQPATVGDVVVALSTRGSFVSQPKWNDFFCIGQEFCDVGDFNGDKATDITAFIKSTSTATQGDVYVALRTAGTGYAFIVTPGIPAPKNMMVGSLIIRKK